MGLRDHWPERGRGGREEQEKAVVVGAPVRKRFGVMPESQR